MQRRREDTNENQPQAKFAKTDRLSTSASTDTFSNGDNFLHRMLRDETITPTKLSIFIRALSIESPECLNLLSRQTNDQGLLPFDVIDILKKTNEEKNQLRLLILPFMASNPFKNHRELINENELKKCLATTTIEKTRGNIKAAIEITNSIRKAIHHSPSHPSWNNESSQYKQKTNAELEDARNEYNDRIDDYLDHSAETNSLEFETVNFSTTEKKLSKYSILEIFAIISEIINENQNANCDEYAYLAFYELLDNDHPAELFTLGAHQFVVIDRDPKSDPSNPLQWGTHAVILDAWAGIVCTANEFANKIHTYKCYDIDDEYYNVAIPYNNKVHKFQLNPAFQTIKNETTISNSSASLFKKTADIQVPVNDPIMHDEPASGCEQDETFGAKKTFL